MPLTSGLTKFSPTQSQKDYISDLPNKLKRNILAYLDPKSLAAISEMSTKWYDQAQDTKLPANREEILEIHENYLQKAATSIY